MYNIVGNVSQMLVVPDMKDHEKITSALVKGNCIEYARSKKQASHIRI